MLTRMELVVIRHGMQLPKIAAPLRLTMACNRYSPDRLAAAGPSKDLRPTNGIDSRAGQLHQRHPRPITLPSLTYRAQLGP